jgi:hypothetical protein
MVPDAAVGDGAVLGGAAVRDGAVLDGRRATPPG